MLISQALAGHGVVDTGSSGGANALLIILAVVLVLGLVYMGQKKWRSRLSIREDDEDLREQ